MRVAILGTGKMGGAMAKRLRESGHELTLWNRTRSRAEALGLGKVASTPAEAARSAEVVISILTDAAAVRNAYLGDDGAARAARDQVFIEMSTAGPEVVKEVRPAIERAGAKFIECPVLGSISAMETGKGILFAAGDDEAIERARPVVEALGEARRIKDPESAATLKLVANTILMGLSALAAGYVDHRYEPVTFALRDGAKDLRLATEVYRRVGASTPMTDKATELFDRAANTVGDLDLSAIMTLYEKQTANPKN